MYTAKGRQVLASFVFYNILTDVNMVFFSFIANWVAGCYIELVQYQ